MKLLLSEWAEHDLLKGYTWYEEKSPYLGNTFLKAMNEKLDQVAKRPNPFAAKSHEKYRQALVNKFPYLIIFRINTEQKIVFVTGIRPAMITPNKLYNR